MGSQRGLAKEKTFELSLLEKELDMRRAKETKIQEGRIMCALGHF